MKSCSETERQVPRSHIRHLFSLAVRSECRERGKGQVSQVMRPVLSHLGRTGYNRHLETQNGWSVRV